MSANRAEFILVVGAPGSGKSLFIKSFLDRRRPARLLVWDALDEYGLYAERVGGVNALVALFQASRAAEFRLRFICSDRAKVRAKQFNAFCQAGFEAGDLVLVVDELGDVTNATLSLVPESWSTVCRKGRHRGLTVIGGVQRPALVDKIFFGAATLVHCGRLNYSEDVREMAGLLGMERERVVTLKPLDFIERDMTTGALTEGVQPLPGAKKTRRASP